MTEKELVCHISCTLHVFQSDKLLFSTPATTQRYHMEQIYAIHMERAATEPAELAELNLTPISLYATFQTLHSTSPLHAMTSVTFVEVLISDSWKRPYSCLAALFNLK